MFLWLTYRIFSLSHPLTVLLNFNLTLSSRVFTLLQLLMPNIDLRVYS